MKLLLTAAALFFWLNGDTAAAAGKPGGSSKDELFGEIDAIVRDLCKITGWKAKRKVPAAYISREKLREFVEGRLKREIRDEEVRIEEQILQMLGLVPRLFDLRKATVELITEQAAAFYDYHARRLFVLDSEESLLDRRVTLAHELAHALADQQFSLKRYIRGGLQGDDMSAARQAVLEGQATWLMWAYLSVRNGKEPMVPVELLANAGLAAESGAAGFPVLEGAPLYLRQSLVFPYTRGLLFANALYKASGQASFNEVFTRPPDSTRQILHPEVWRAGTRTRAIQPPTVRNEKHDLKLRAEGTMGEFDHQVLIHQYINEETADRIAPRWRAGSYRLFHRKAGNKAPLLTYASEWDTPETATWFFALYKGIMARKAKNTIFAVDTPTRFAGSNEWGRFEVWTEDNKVFSVEGRNS